MAVLELHGRARVVSAPRRTRVNETGCIQRELDAKAADDAVWLALHLVQRAGWGDLLESLAALKAETSARRRAIEQGQV